MGVENRVEPYFKHADIFVMPSYYEALPAVLLQGMSSNNACISYDIGDLNRRFKHKKDIIFSSKQRLSQDIEYLAENPKVRKQIAKNAKKIMSREEYTWPGVVKRVEKVYKSLKNKEKQ